MKRDMELIRAILLKTEELPPNGDGRTLEIEGYAEPEINYHARLAVEAGLMRADFADNADFTIPESLTWAGHEFLDAARQDTFWNRWKGTLSNNGVAVTFEALKQVLPILVRSMIGAA